MPFINLNGKLYDAQHPVLPVTNRAFRYGEGLFETIKVFKGNILLEDYHWDRLALGMKFLQMKQEEWPGKERLKEQIDQLCHKNDCAHLARVRLQVFSNDEGSLQYLLEATALDPSFNRLNESGWKIDLYPYARKACEAFSNIKTCNHLPYMLASRYAKEKGLDDCLLLNSENNIADSTMANVFVYIKGELITPALHQGCINGVMRRTLIEKGKSLGLTIRQGELSEEHLLTADEVFLTNAIRGIRWVESFREKTYGKASVAGLYKKLFEAMYS